MNNKKPSELLRELKDILSCREQDIVKNVKKFKKEIKENKENIKRLERFLE